MQCFYKCKYVRIFCESFYEVLVVSLQLITTNSVNRNAKWKNNTWLSRVQIFFIFWEGFLVLIMFRL